ncbi:MAG: hypothetical protein RL309_1463 [Verrucomicrobiota bacterium]
MKARAPEHFVGHPIADAREALLHQQHRFNRRARSSTQEDLDDSDGEFGREDCWRDFLPPRRNADALPKLDATELPRVDEGELLAAGHCQLKVVVGCRLAVGVAGFEATRHPKMHADPDITRKAKGHLLRRGEGFDQLRARERLTHRLHIQATSDPCLRIQEYRRDLSSDARLPAATEIFDFSEFGHARATCRMVRLAQASGPDGGT